MITDLPSELLVLIMAGLESANDRVSLLQTCKYLHRTLEHTLYEHLWLCGESTKGIGVLQLPPSLPRERTTFVQKRSALIQVLRQRVDLRKQIKSITAYSWFAELPEEPPVSEDWNIESDVIVGTALQTHGGPLPELRLVGNGRSFDYTYRGHVNSWYMDSGMAAIGGAQLYKVVSSPRLQSFHLLGPLLSPSWSWQSDSLMSRPSQPLARTVNLRHLVLDARLETLLARPLRALLSWPRALESFTCRGFQRPFRDRVTSRPWNLVEWLRPQRKTLKMLRLLAFKAQVMPMTRIKPLLNNLSKLAALETLYIGLESLMAFDNDVDLSEADPQTAEEASLAPCKLPPSLKTLYVRVSLNITAESPDPDDMNEKRAALEWLAEAHPYLHSVHIWMVCSGATPGDWGPAIVQRRANDILECREAFAKQGIKVFPLVMLEELGEDGLFAFDAEKGWRFLPAWWKTRQAACQNVHWWATRFAPNYRIDDEAASLPVPNAGDEIPEPDSDSAEDDL